MNNPKELFQLKENFTKDELKKSFITKVDNLNNIDIGNIEKNILLDVYKQEYNNAKYLLENNGISKSNNITHDPLLNLNNMMKRNAEMIGNLQMNMKNKIQTSIPKFDTLPTTYSNSYSKSQSIKSFTNFDKSTVVIEESNVNNNGKINKITNSYKIDSDGRKIPINIDFAKKQIDNN